VISEAKWDHFEVSSQPNVFTIVEAIYGPDLILTPSPDIEMTVDTLEAEEVAFTLVTNKKYKRKDKLLLFLLCLCYKLHSACISTTSEPIFTN